MNTTFSASILPDTAIDRIIENGRRLLAEVGVVVENAALLDLLATHGADIDRGAMRARFDSRMLDALMDDSSESYDEMDGLEMSCLFPYGERAAYSHGVECTAGTYPTAYLDLNGEVRPHTAASVADMTRLADAMEHIDRLGAMGVPSDVPARLAPLYQRLLAWKHAERKLSGSGGNFMGHEHTAAFYRSEHWQPALFSRESLGSWLASDRKIDTTLAGELCEEALRNHHPQGDSVSAEKALLDVIEDAKRWLC